MATSIGVCLAECIRDASYQGDTKEQQCIRRGTAEGAPDACGVDDTNLIKGEAITLCYAPTSMPGIPVDCLRQPATPTSLCYIEATLVGRELCQLTSSISSTSSSSNTVTRPPNLIGSGGKTSTSTISQPATSTGVISGANKAKAVDPKTGYQPPGAVAGIAIGTAIFGAAIAGLIFLFLLKRYRKRHLQQSAYTQHLPPSGYVSEGASAEKGRINVAQIGVAAAVDSYLPQPAEDDAITGELSRLRDKIKNHVQSYYITSPVDSNAVDASNLRGIAAVTGVSPAKFQELLHNPLSRLPTIRVFLAWVTLSNSGVGGAGAALLPTEIASFVAFLVDIDTGNAARAALVSKWKAISGELLRGRYSQKVADSSNLDHIISQTIGAADTVLAPFINQTIEASSDKRLRNLDSIMRRAADLAFLLFAQPGSFIFDWKTSRGGIIVFPGLTQVVAEDGTVCRPPRIFSSPEVGQ